MLGWLLYFMAKAIPAPKGTCQNQPCDERERDGERERDRDNVFLFWLLIPCWFGGFFSKKRTIDGIHITACPCLCYKQQGNLEQVNRFFLMQEMHRTRLVSKNYLCFLHLHWNINLTNTIKIIENIFCNFMKSRSIQNEIFIYTQVVFRKSEDARFLWWFRPTAEENWTSFNSQKCFLHVLYVVRWSVQRSLIPSKPH